jgi:hypothetical protein
MEERMKHKRKTKSKVVKEIEKNRDLLEIIHYKVSEILHKIKGMFL